MRRMKTMTKWVVRGQKHRLDGPAEICHIGSNAGRHTWFIKNQIHRDDGPARTYEGGQFAGLKEWYQHGKRHRDNGPAIDRSGMSIPYYGPRFEWYQRGVKHRDGGPAESFKDGKKVWWKNGLKHRTDGPAVKTPDGYREWWVNGQLHRIDGPAIENPGIAKTIATTSYREEVVEGWYQNGVSHRLDGPALIFNSQRKEYRVDGELHSECGPALITFDGYCKYFYYGEEPLDPLDFLDDSWRKEVLLKRIK
jgi:hypothetical protein